MAVRDRSFDPVQVAHAGEAEAGLEGAAATGAGAVLLWGWLFQPEGGAVELACDLGGRTVPVELLDRTSRPDVIESFAASVRSRAPDVGFLGLAQVDAETLKAAGGRATLVVRLGDQSSGSTNRLLFEPGSTFEETVGRRLPTRVMRPEALRRAAEALWPPEGARILGEALRSLRSQRVGPPRSPELSIVIPVADNLGTLRQTLSDLDMDPESSRVEVVFSLARDELWATVETAVEDAATDLSVVLVRTGEALSVAAAARVGLEVATAERVLMMSDAVAPPARGWVGSVIEHLDGADFGSPDAMPRFDGLVHRFEPRSPARDASLWSHEAMRTSLLDSMRDLGLDIRSPEVLAARRRALLDADIPWAEAREGPAFWTGLLNEAVRRGSPSWASGNLFTYAPVDHRPDTDWRLLDLYALEARLAGWVERIEWSKAMAEPS